MSAKPGMNVGGPLGMVKGGVEAAGGAEMFLSARVVDQRAFDELAAALRGVVEQAAAERRQLLSVLERAFAGEQALRALEGAQNQGMELAARAVRRIDEQAALAAELLARAETAAVSAADAQSRRESTERTVQGRLEASASEALSRVLAIESRLDRAAADLQQRVEALQRDAAGVAAPVLERLTALCERAEAAAARLHGAEMIGAECAGVAAGAQAAVEQAVRLHDTTGIALASLERAVGRAESASAGLERLIAGAERAMRGEAREQPGWSGPAATREVFRPEIVVSPLAAARVLERPFAGVMGGVVASASEGAD